MSSVRLSRSTAKRAALHVGAAQRVVARQQVWRADVAAVAARRHHEFADGGGVAQAEIEALRADRRDEMGGLADERDAVLRRSVRTVSTASGNTPRPGSTVILPRIECERCSISSLSAASSSAAIRSASAGSTTQTRLDRSPGSGTSVNGPLSVWNSVEVSWCGRRVREIEGQRGLRIGAAVALDAGRGAAERTPSVGADDEAGGDAVAAFERNGHAGVVGFDRAGFVLDPRQRRQLSARAHRARRADAGSRCCGRTHRGRSRTRRSAPPARGQAGRWRRRSA